MTYYHGSSSRCLKAGSYRLMPPFVTGVLSERGRMKNLDKVFFTTDLGSARIYAGRAVQQFGGSPVVYRVIPMGEVGCLNTAPGTSVYHSSWGFLEEIR